MTKFHQHFTRHEVFGSLPAALVILTIATGAVDAVSLLSLGRVFAANMTGNVVFIGFSLAGVSEYSIWGSVVALLAFIAGAWGGGTLAHHHRVERTHLLRRALTYEAGLMATALILALIFPDLEGLGIQLIILILLSFALGIQNAVARSLAIPDLTTTVLTLTITGITADIRKKDYLTTARRILVVFTMMFGGFLGATLVLTTIPAAGLALALVCVGSSWLVAGMRPAKRATES